VSDELGEGLVDLDEPDPEKIPELYAPQEGQADQGGNGFQGGEA
jgi:hypothetical protein